MSHAVPIERKVALGNPGKRALPEVIDTGMAPVQAVPPTPPSLRRHGSVVWEQLWTFARAWLAIGTDVNVVLRYCEAHDLRAELQATIAGEGRFTEGSTGQLVEHPASKMLRELDRDILRMEGALGLTPSDRAKLGLAVLTAAEKKSRLELFMDGEL